MIELFEEMSFLEFVLEKLEKEIEYQEALIENEKKNFYDKQLDFELCKELHKLEKWRDKVKEYIRNLESVRKIKKENVMDTTEQIAKLLKSNKELAERNRELVEEIKLLNEEINRKNYNSDFYYSWNEGD